MIEKTEEQQRFHAQMLADCKSILDKYKIKSILSGSALLGMIRDGHLVPWEAGLVLIVISNEIEKYQNQIIDDLKQQGFLIKKHFPGLHNFKIQSWKENFNIEMTGYYKEGEYYYRRTKARLRNIPEYFLNNAKMTVKIYDMEYIIPNDVENYLTHLYDDWHKVIRSDSGIDFRSKNFIRKI